MLALGRIPAEGDVVLLPHLGSATRETRDAMGMLALDGIGAVLAGREPENAVV